MNVGKWWSSIPEHMLPQWGDGLVSFMTPVVALFSDMLPVGVRCAWTDKIDSAYADRANKRLVVSSKILSKNLEQRPNKSADRHSAMAAVLGVQLHEIFHFLYSPATIPELMPVGVKADKIRGDIANIMEDVYIENRILTEKPDLAWMLTEGEWPYFFSASEGVKFHAKWNGQKPESMEDVKAALASICQTWRYFGEIGSHGEYEDGLRRLLMSVVGMTVLDDRRNLVEEIAQYLNLPEVQANQDKGKGQNDEGDGEAQEGEGQEQEGGEGEGDGEAPGKFAGASGEEAPDEEIYGDYTIESDARHRMIDLDNAGDVPVVVYTGETGAQGQALPVNRVWDKLAELQKDVSTARRIPGPAGHVGRLTNPERMFSDGRMFSNAVLETADGGAFAYRPLEIVVLIDRSGSMDDGNKFKNATVAAANMVRALSNAGVNVMVATHHTGGYQIFEEKCVINIIKFFKDSYAAALPRFQTMFRIGATGANADADALKYMAKQFSPASNGRRRLLIVISDGQPSCSTYGGRPGIERTKKAVDGIRKQGIEVYSISIDNVAIAPNDVIYGPKFNVSSNDPNVAASLLKKLVQQ